MRNRKVSKTVPFKADVVLLEQVISHQNGFDLADQPGDVFETRKVPIVVVAAFLNRTKS